MAERNVFHVMPTERGDWMWRSDDGGSRSFATREEALSDAIRRAEREPDSQVLVRAEDATTEIYRNVVVRRPEDQAARRSRAHVRGHPIHPYLIPFPVGLLSGAAALDVTFAITTNPFWAELSFWALVGGLVTALVAAVPGLVDFVGIRAVRRTGIGWGHFLLNLTAVVLTLANILLRMEQRTDNVVPAGLLLSLAVFSGLVVSGWLGGALTYERRIALVPR